MPTLEELQDEAVFRQEYVPPRLKGLAEDVREWFNLTPGQVGTIGDHRHLKGYHRSRAWILQSKHCTNRRYSVTETPGNRTGGDMHWISGMDIVPGKSRAQLIERRLQFAKAQGHLPHVRQIILERDPWHIHISLDRRHANDPHTSLFNAITGQFEKETPVTTFPITMPVLRKGSTGQSVIIAQKLLQAHGIELDADGEFGNDTDRATRDMQEHYGAESVDGVWGPETWTIAITGKDTR